MDHYIDNYLTMQHRIFIASAVAELVHADTRYDEIPLRISLFFNIM